MILYPNLTIACITFLDANGKPIFFIENMHLYSNLTIACITLFDANLVGLNE